MHDISPNCPVRLVVCDIDGTLVRDDKSLSPVTVAAVDRLRAAGISMSLISARPVSGMRPIADALGLDDGLFAAFNGGTLFDRNGIVGVPVRISAQTARHVLSVLDAAGIEPWLFVDDRWYARNADNPHVPRERLSACLAPTLRSDLHALCDVGLDKIIGVHDDPALLARTETVLRQAIGNDAMIALSQPYFFDITARMANKGEGVQALAAATGYDLAQVAVIGDMPNDLPMFARAGLSIAMGQSPEAVRAAADWVTGSNEDDGVAQAFDRLIVSNAAVDRLMGTPWPDAVSVLAPEAPPLGNTELVQLQIRVIALEGLVVALLAACPDDAIAGARAMAARISPRAGHTPHRLTLHASRLIRSLIRRAQRARRS